MPDDSVKFAPVATHGGTFTATFPFDQGPGRYQVEINNSSGEAVINVPMFVGGAVQAGSRSGHQSTRPRRQTAPARRSTR
jgi:hypothetical protein